MGHDAGAAGFHHYVSRAVSVHFGSALLGRDAVALDSNRFPYSEGISAHADWSAQMAA